MLCLVTRGCVREEQLVVLREAVHNFDFHRVSRTVRLRSIEENLVRVELLRGDVLRIELVVD